MTSTGLARIARTPSPAVRAKPRHVARSATRSKWASPIAATSHTPSSTEMPPARRIGSRSDTPAEQERHRHGDERGSRAEPAGAQEQPGERHPVGLAELAGEPGDRRPARERVGDPPHDLADQHAGDRRVRRLDQEADADADVTDDHRPLPRPQVGHDAGGDLEAEDGGLHHRAGEHQLEVVEPGDLEAVERRDRERQRGDERGDRGDADVHPVRARHEDLLSSTDGRGQSEAVMARQPQPGT